MEYFYTWFHSKTSVSSEKEVVSTRANPCLWLQTFEKNGNILETNASRQFSFGHNADGVDVVV